VVNAPPGGLTPLDWILETGASYVMGVPTHAMDILGEMRRRGLDRLGAVKTFYMAGSPIPREVAQSFLDRGVVPQNVYGMSENSSHQYTLPSDKAETSLRPAGGVPAPVRLFDQNPDPRWPGEIGRSAAATPV
jgi:acyl-CoA synthetase